MNWKIYKEGQGKWARNSVAALIAIMAVFAATSLYNSLPDPTSTFEIRGSILEKWFSVSDWGFDYRFVIAAPLLLVLMYFGVWQYSHPRWADFLIDTENELKNRVTWPSGKEVLTNSVVVVVAVVIIGIYTFFADIVFQAIQDEVYTWFY